MISETILQAYFNTHPLADTLNGFPAAARHAALNAADLDVAAELGRPVTDADDALLRAALAEQTIHLLLHPEVISGTVEKEILSESIEGVGSRTYKCAERTAGVLGSRVRALLSSVQNVSSLRLGRG